MSFACFLCLYVEDLDSRTAFGLVLYLLYYWCWSVGWLAGWLCHPHLVWSSCNIYWFCLSIVSGMLPVVTRAIFLSSLDLAFLSLFLRSSPQVERLSVEME